MKVKIFGAGSIGNHLAHASRKLGWEVDIYDINSDALNRTKNLIYPSRYKRWDKRIGLYLNNHKTKKKYDFIIIGTPPETHIPLALQALKAKPKYILIEKPLCLPDLINAQKLYSMSKKSNTKIFIGYDHTVSKSINYLSSIIKKFKNNNIQNLEVDFKESWKGIFRAHPWIKNVKDSYLGYWKKGGGALSEHSHALNLWLILSSITNSGRVSEVFMSSNIYKDKFVEYDQSSYITLKTENGVYGRVSQDIFTFPAIKMARIQFENKYMEWHCNKFGKYDLVNYHTNNKIKNKKFNKTRPDDFIQELRHISKIKNKKQYEMSPIKLQNGLETMLVISAAHLSYIKGRTIKINYKKPFTNKALSVKKI